MFGSLIVMTGMIFIPFFSQNIQTFLAGAVMQGIPWGVFQTLTTTYASEVAPVKVRPYLTTYVNLCWVIGQLIAAGVLRGLLHGTSQWAYRIPFALQWVWPPLILIGVIFAPESPWYVSQHIYHCIYRLTVHEGGWFARVNLLKPRRPLKDSPRRIAELTSTLMIKL